MAQKKRSSVDRRNGEDRRKDSSAEYLASGKPERRTNGERRVEAD